MIWGPARREVMRCAFWSEEILRLGFYSRYIPRRVKCLGRSSGHSSLAMQYHLVRAICWQCYFGFAFVKYGAARSTSATRCRLQFPNDVPWTGGLGLLLNMVLGD